MKLIEINGMHFNVRDNSSDEKTIREVIEKNSYRKKWFQIEEGEKWLDLGGNIGAFSVLATHCGATVRTYEPDPFNCMMIKKNLKQNNSFWKAEVIQAAVVHDEQKTAMLNLWPQGQSWRNSIVRNKKGTTPMAVPCVNLFEVIEKFPYHNIKMDIEGSEINILKNWPVKTTVNKLVFEWSFDVDQKTETLRQAIKRLSWDFNNIKYTSQIDKIEEWKFFPPCTMVHCWKS